MYGGFGGQVEYRGSHGVVKAYATRIALAGLQHPIGFVVQQLHLQPPEPALAQVAFGAVATEYPSHAGE